MRKEEAEGEAVRARLVVVETLRRTEYDLEQRVAERTQALTELNLQLMEQENHLKGMALRDPLTGLENRILLDQHTADALKEVKNSGSRFALLMLDLDRFKPINDRYGHEVGDRLLKAIARLGGGEFVILLRNGEDAEMVQRVGEGVLKALSQPVQIGELSLEVGVSIGAAFYPEHGTDAVSLLPHADKAVYQAKQAGRNQLSSSCGLDEYWPG